VEWGSGEDREWEWEEGDMDDGMMDREISVGESMYGMMSRYSRVSKNSRVEE
jgi:hypothetical protein